VERTVEVLGLHKVVAVVVEALLLQGVPLWFLNHTQLS
jgi:hypothetical protein